MSGNLIINSLDGPRSCVLKLETVFRLETVVNGHWDGLDLSQVAQANRSTLHQLLARAPVSSFDTSNTSKRTAFDASGSWSAQVENDLSMPTDSVSLQDRVICQLMDVSETEHPVTRLSPTEKTHGRRTAVIVCSSGLDSVFALKTENLSSRIWSSGRPFQENSRTALLRRAAEIRAVEDIPWCAKFLRHFDPQDYKNNALCERGKKQRSSLSGRRRTRVPLTRITWPIEHFNGRAELLRVFRSYFRIVIILREYGLEHRNISLENLSIANTQNGSARGVITSYDEKCDPSRQRRPCFIYTMPCRLLSEDLSGDFKHLNSLESVFLCLIWIVTTRSGSHDNQKRTEDYSFCSPERYRFSDTELGMWNQKRDWECDIAGRHLLREKHSVMHDQDSFDFRIISRVHPHFKRIKNYLRVLRALIYDPQWEEARNLLADPDTSSYYARRALVGTFTSIMEDASKFDNTALERALAEPARTDANTTVGWGNRSVDCLLKRRDGWDVEAFETYRHGSSFRFVLGRKADAPQENASLLTDCKVLQPRRSPADGLMDPHHGVYNKIDPGEWARNHRIRVVSYWLHAPDIARKIKPLICRWVVWLSRGNYLPLEDCGVRHRLRRTRPRFVVLLANLSRDEEVDW